MTDKEELDKLFSICSVNLKNSKPCLDYLSKRGFSDEFIKKNKIGYFPQNIRALTKYVDEESLIRLGVICPGNWSKFCNNYSMVFPIHDEYNEPVGIAGRTLASESERSTLGLSKYENSKYKKSKILYGLNNSRGHILKNNNVYVVEGYFDHISMDMNGIRNSVAICGTAFSNNHFIKLLRYTDTITFLLDNDDAGRKSMENIFYKYSGKGANLQFKKLPEGYKDIDQFFFDGKTRQMFENSIEDFLMGW